MSNLSLKTNKTSVESVELGKTLDLELSFVCPPLQGIRLRVVDGWVWVWAGALGGEIHSLGEACITNLSPLLCLEPFKKFLVGGGGWW